MSSLNETLALPNPFTPLAFLAPEAAYQATVTSYWVVGALAVRLSTILNDTLSNHVLIACMDRFMYGIFWTTFVLTGA